MLKSYKWDGWDCISERTSAMSTGDANNTEGGFSGFWTSRVTQGNAMRSCKPQWKYTVESICHITLPPWICALQNTFSHKNIIKMPLQTGSLTYSQTLPQCEGMVLPRTRGRLLWTISVQQRHQWTRRSWLKKLFQWKEIFSRRRKSLTTKRTWPSIGFENGSCWGCWIWTWLWKSDRAGRKVHRGKLWKGLKPQSWDLGDTWSGSTIRIHRPSLSMGKWFLFWKGIELCAHIVRKSS